MEYLARLLMIFHLVFLIGVPPTFCDSGADKLDSQLSTSRQYYTFSPGHRELFEGARPLRLPENYSVSDVLDTLSVHLARGYFGRITNDQPTNIQINLVRLEELPSTSRSIWIAVFDMIDPQELALGYFFQGSDGGAKTAAMISATLLQPQTDPPLLDGLIFLYNGAVLPRLDHINLSGILIPETIEYQVRRAIRGQPRAK